MDSNSPSINSFTIGDTKTIQAGNSVTTSFPVMSSKQIENFSQDLLGGLNVNYTYYVDVKVKLKEVYTNADLEKQIRFTLSVRNVISDTECNNTNTNTNVQ